MLLKKCAKCGIEKPLSEFFNRKNRKGVMGPRSRCKECEREDKRAWYAANPSVHLKTVEWMNKKEPNYQRNRRRERRANMTEKEKVAVRISGVEYYSEHREDILARQRTNNKKPDRQERRRSTENLRLDTDIDFALRKKLRNRVNHALKGKKKSGSATKDLGCTVPELRTHLESKFQSGMTWKNQGFGFGKWNIDHVVPLAAYDLSNRQHFVLANHFKNLQPLWHEENMSKGDTYPTFPWAEAA